MSDSERIDALEQKVAALEVQVQGLRDGTDVNGIMEVISQNLERAAGGTPLSIQ